MVTKLLTLSALSWSVETKPILRKLSFNVAQGDVIGIIGPNGAGKTSLLKCLLNQHKNWQGSIKLKNKSISDYQPHELAKIFALVVSWTCVAVGKLLSLRILLPPVAAQVMLRIVSVDAVPSPVTTKRRIPYFPVAGHAVKVIVISAPTCIV